MDTFDYVNDPLTAGQIATLVALLQEEWSEKARDGFLVVSGRFIDETGTDRTGELKPLFHTDRSEGRLSLRRSLEALFDAAGSLEQFVSFHNSPSSVLPLWKRTSIACLTPD